MLMISKVAIDAVARGDARRTEFVPLPPTPVSASIRQRVIFVSRSIIQVGITTPDRRGSTNIRTMKVWTYEKDLHSFLPEDDDSCNPLPACALSSSGAVLQYIPGYRGVQEAAGGVGENHARTD